MKIFYKIKKLFDYFFNFFTKINQKLKDAENKVIPEPADLLLFEEEIETIKKEIEDIPARIHSVASELDVLREEYNEFKMKNDDYEKDITHYTGKIDHLNKSFKDLNDELNTAKDNQEYYKKLTKKEIEKENELIEKIAHQKSSIKVCLFFQYYIHFP